MSPTMTSMNPSILLLGEQNWNQWRTYIRGRLLTKGLWYVMDVTKSGDRRVGESTEAAKTRLQTDMDKAYGIIIEGIEPSQYQYIEDAETATAAYKALSDHHEPKSKIDKLALSSEYHSMSWNIKEETLPEFLERYEVVLRKLRECSTGIDTASAIDRLLFLMPWQLRHIAHQVVALPADQKNMTLGEQGQFAGEDCYLFSATVEPTLSAEEVTALRATVLHKEIIVDSGASAHMTGDTRRERL
ncbi:hypothetical protein DYB36_011595 [Aphanomyces astaci]|uniref:DUF4219 domain-containing protein n=1 Tax=Aphanomyces astaci TaxID=112090 RepID=A0A397A585_APHAT|nr:hypothetical protein DYB36_011595 [Aphanomyces astaci]